MKKNKHKFVKAWRAPDDILEFIKSKFKGRVLNLCAGETLYGDVNVDLFPKNKAVIKADVLDPDFDLGEKFDTVIADPPWNWDYVQRHTFSKTVQKHLKHDGVLILNAPWFPNFKLDVQEMYIPLAKGGFQKNITAISISRYT